MPAPASWGAQSGGIHADHAARMSQGRKSSHTPRHPSPNARFARGSGWQAASFCEHPAKDALRRCVGGPAQTPPPGSPSPKRSLCSRLDSSLTLAALATSDDRSGSQAASQRASAQEGLDFFHCNFRPYTTNRAEPPAGPFDRAPMVMKGLDARRLTAARVTVRPETVDGRSMALKSLHG